MASTEFNLVILILLIRDAFSICSICCFMLRCLSMWTPKNLTVSAIFSRCPYTVIDDSLITFLCEKLIRCALPGFNLILHLSQHVRIWFRYFCNLNLYQLLINLNNLKISPEISFEKLTWDGTPYPRFAVHVLNCCKVRPLLSFWIFHLTKIF